MATNNSVIDATNVFDATESEHRVKQAFEDRFPCELIKRTEQYDPIDFDIFDPLGDVVGHAELKARAYASTSVVAAKGPVIGLHKYTALRREELHSGVPSWLIVEWSDRVVQFVAISDVARLADGSLAVLPNLRRTRRPGRRSDVEPQVWFPAASSSLIIEASAWPFGSPWHAVERDAVGNQTPARHLAAVA